MVLDDLTKLFQNKKVLIVGLGIQGGGVSITKFIAERGAKVTVTDKKNESQLKTAIDNLKDYSVTYRLGKHTTDDFLNADIIFKGPSVPWTMPEIKAAQEKGIPIEMEASFFASVCPCPIIGITGTRGKSTTTNLIFQILKNAGKSVYLAGNIPQNPMINLLEKLQPDDVVVAELSSWQLSGFHQKKVSPHIGVFTNLYPDHLNYYPTMEEYYYDKSAIYKYQKSDDILIANEMLKTNIEKDTPLSQIYYFNKDIFPSELLLVGEHNRENASAAYLVGRAMGIDESLIIKTIQSFSSLPYRLQKIATINGVDVINDTTSTTPVACEKAIEAFSKRPITLILGGNSKNLPYQTLLPKLNLVKHIILLKGTFTEEIYSQLDKSKVIGQPYDSLDRAVESAFNNVDPKGVILFSPGATSFAQFKNEFHRGDEFNRIVSEYEKSS